MNDNFNGYGNYGGGRNYNNGGYNNNYGGNRQYRSNYRNNNYGANQPQQRFKKSGAVFTLIKRSNTGKSVGMHIVNAWIKTRQGLVKIVASGYKKRKGKTCEWENAVATVTNMATGQSAKYATLINVTTRRMKIKELGWMVTAKGGGTTRSGKRVTGAVIQIKNGG